MPPELAFVPLVSDAVSQPAVIASAVGVGVLLTAVLWFRPRRATAARTLREKVGRTVERFRDEDIDRALYWLPRDSGGGDRRRGSRRAGPVTSIRVSEAPHTDSEVEEGLVLDRSTGGLCFAAHRVFPEGAVVFVRAVGAPSGSPWVGVTVRHCRNCDDY